METWNSRGYVAGRSDSESAGPGRSMKSLRWNWKIWQVEIQDVFPGRWIFRLGRVHLHAQPFQIFPTSTVGCRLDRREVKNRKHLHITQSLHQSSVAPSLCPRVKRDKRKARSSWRGGTGKTKARPGFGRCTMRIMLKADVCPKS